jgi:hypothetical protein
LPNGLEEDICVGCEVLTELKLVEMDQPHDFCFCPINCFSVFLVVLH